MSSDHDDSFGYPTVCGLTWCPQSQCVECHVTDDCDAGYHYNECTETSWVVGHRAMFFVSRGDPPTIECKIDQFCVWDHGDFLLSRKPDLSNPLDGGSLSSPGETVEWANLREEGSGVASSTSFEFSETMDDSTTAETFEPHVSILSQIFGITDISKQIRSRADSAAVYMKKGKALSRVGKHAKPTGYDLEKFEKSLAGLKREYAKIIRENFEATHKKYGSIYTAEYYPDNFESGLECVDMIAGLIAHGLVECEARKDCYSITEARAAQMQKPCAHVAPKTSAR